MHETNREDLVQICMWEQTFPVRKAAIIRCFYLDSLTWYVRELYPGKLCFNWGLYDLLAVCVCVLSLTAMGGCNLTWVGLRNWLIEGCCCLSEAGNEDYTCAQTRNTLQNPPPRPRPLPAQCSCPRLRLFVSNLVLCGQILWGEGFLGKMRKSKRIITGASYSFPLCPTKCFTDWFP